LEFSRKRHRASELCCYSKGRGSYFCVKLRSMGLRSWGCAVTPRMRLTLWRPKREWKRFMSGKRQAWGEAPWKIRFRALQKPLPAQADFVVIGGGFTGLSAAAALKRLAPENSVVLLEAERIGNGASGRTGGMALAQSAAGNLPGLGDVL